MRIICGISVRLPQPNSFTSCFTSFGACRFIIELHCLQKIHSTKMAEKRKVRQSTRRYGEPPLKKRILTTSPAPELSEPADEGLPSRLRDNQDLPALLVQQDQDLCSKEYQSIAERLVSLLIPSLIIAKEYSLIAVS